MRNGAPPRQTYGCGGLAVVSIPVDYWPQPAVHFRMVEAENDDEMMMMMMMMKKKKKM